MMDYCAEINGLFDFLKNSPTAFHAVNSLCNLLKEQGFIPLQECNAWEIAPGGKYFVTRNCSSVIAFTLPEGTPDSFRIIASHSDSPTFKIKENAELTVRDKYVQLNTERYGGMIFSSWFDRPLSVAGRVLYKDDNGIHTRLVKIDRDLVMIPNVAIHMNREVNNGFKYNAQVDLMPLYGNIDAKGSFRKLIAEACGIEEDAIVGNDLYLYNRMPGTVWGANNEFLSAPQLDDLECAYASVCALKDLPDQGHVNVCCVFDNEEVGSGTKQGADSTFLSDVLARIASCLNMGSESYRMALAGSFMLSADNAHATHPNHPEYADQRNQVEMNKGIVIKFNANQKYTTDGVSAAVFHQICKDAEVPVQHFANRSDLPGGSTLGNISGAHISINTLDIGLAQLAMHSCYETAGVKDLAWMIQGMHAFYACKITAQADGEYGI